jgi:hypothetical protein
VDSIGIRAASIVASAALVWTAGCGDGGAGRLTGSGRIVTREVPISSFSTIEVTHAFDVEITTGGAPSLRVHVDNNLVGSLDVGVREGVLHIGFKAGRDVTDATLFAEVHGPSPSVVEASGASRIHVSGGLDAPVEIDLSGASRLRGRVRSGEVSMSLDGSSLARLGGNLERLTLHGDGSSTFVGSDLRCEDVEIRLDGSSTAALTVTGTISAQLSGGSILRYEGSPEFTRRATSGGSSILPVTS